MGGCFWLLLQAQRGDTYFTELAERVEYANYVYIYIYIYIYIVIIISKMCVHEVLAASGIARRAAAQPEKKLSE